MAAEVFKGLFIQKLDQAEQSGETQWPELCWLRKTYKSKLFPVQLHNR